VIETDDQMLLAQQCTHNLRAILLEARKVHSPEDYSRMAEPILLEIQPREQEIIEYLQSLSLFRSGPQQAECLPHLTAVAAQGAVDGGGHARGIEGATGEAVELERSLSWVAQDFFVAQG